MSEGLPDDSNMGIVWHSDRYSATDRPQDDFKQFWVNALTDTGKPMSASMVRDWVMRYDYLVGLGSWCLSYGKERALRAGFLTTYYQEAWEEIGPGDSVEIRDKKIAAVVGERLHYYSRSMQNHRELVSTGEILTIPKTDFLYHQTLGNNRREGKLPLYTLGPKPIKVREYGTKKLIAYDPHKVDWDARMNHAMNKLRELDRMKRPTNADLRAAISVAVKAHDRIDDVEGRY